MEKIKLFEIPIYSMKEKVYEKRCMKYIENQANKTTTDNYDSFYQFLRNENLIQRPWLYNQIVGFIVISYYQSSIWFDEYATLDRKIHALGNTKHYIKNMYLNGHHFYISEKMSNEEIKSNVILWINSIEKNVLSKIWFLDKSTFEKQLKCIDILKLIDDGSD